MSKRLEFYPDEKDRRKYLRQWVANYEIGNFLKRYSNNGNSNKSSNNSNNTNIHFIRFNEYPAKADATPDHAVHLEKEKRFGGVCNENGTVTYQEQDSVYFIQSKFDDDRDNGKEEGIESRENVFFSPMEWELEPKFTRPQIIMVDLGGHFSAGLICRLSRASTFRKDPEKSCVCNFFYPGNVSKKYPSFLVCLMHSCAQSLT